MTPCGGRGGVKQFAWSVLFSPVKGQIPLSCLVLKECWQGLWFWFLPKDPSVRKKRKKSGGSGRKTFTEGWVEFKSKRIAKSVALSLNNTCIGLFHVLPSIIFYWDGLYLLLTKCVVRTASYGPVFFLALWPMRFTHKKREKRGSITYGTDQANEVNKIQCNTTVVPVRTSFRLCRHSGKT